MRPLVELEKGYELNCKRRIKAAGQPASNETVTILVGQKGGFDRDVSWAHSVRKQSQIEISKTDSCRLE
ncbi:MAG: hypothetical protein ACLSAC_27760 [Enterocloster bolteae]